MESLRVNNKEYKIRELTIGDYYEVKDSISMENHKKAVIIVNKLTSIPVSELREMKTEEWMGILSAVIDTVDCSMDANAEILREIKLGNDMFYLIDLDNMSVGEFIDLDLILAGDDPQDKTHEVLAIIYRKKDENGELMKYSSLEADKYKDLFKDMIFRDALSATNFFFRSGKSQLSNIQDYLNQDQDQTTKIMKDMMKTIIREMPECGFPFSLS